MIIFPLFVTVYGFILGSFFNVLICRIPENKSILHPASHCPNCKTTLKPWHNIPIISYLLLQGKCGFCRQPISPLYPLIEFVTGAAALILWFLLFVPRLPASWPEIIPLFIQSFFLLLIIPISVIDLKHYIIPDRFTLSLLVIGAAVSFLPGPLTPLSCLFGILAGGGSLYAVGWIGTAILKKDAMGGGDIKLMAAAGALWGAQPVLLSIVFGAVIGSVYGIVLMLFRKINTEHQIPFGPFLGAGIWVAVLYGDAILTWYLSFISNMAGR